jgi:capsid protein
MALLTGALQLPSRNPALYWNVKHRPRGWNWIDPEKEAKGAVLSIQNGLSTCTRILAEKGEDIEELIIERARELALAKEHGVTIVGIAPEVIETPDRKSKDDQADDA